MKEIDINKNIFQLTNEYPELISILFDLGFREIVKPGMLNTVGKFMKLKQGCSLRGINYLDLINKLTQYNFTIIRGG